MRIGIAVSIAFVGLTLVAPRHLLAQQQAVAQAVAAVRRSGDEAPLVHLAEEIGPAGLAVCVEHAGRAGRLLCVQAARYLERPWSALPVLAAVLEDHDRQVASRAAESMVVIVERLQTQDLGDEEAMPDDGELLLHRLRQAVQQPGLSPDVRSQVVYIFGIMARLVGAALDVPRLVLTGDADVAVRRVAVAVLAGSRDGDDVQALMEVAKDDDDLLVAAQAAAGVCEATLLVGHDLPRSMRRAIRRLLRHEGARPAVIGALLACVARAPRGASEDYRAWAREHPHEGTRALWRQLERGGP